MSFYQCTMLANTLFTVPIVSQIDDLNLRYVIQMNIPYLPSDYID